MSDEKKPPTKKPAIRKIGEVERHPVPEIIDFLEQALAAARHGQLSSIAACFSLDGSGLEQFAYGQTDSREVFQYCGQLQAMQMTMILGLMEDAE